MDVYRLSLAVLSLIAVMLTSLTEATISQLGTLYIISPQRFETDPHAGHRNQGEFAAKHGYRGSRLIESIGNGQFHPGHHGIYRRNPRYSYRQPFYFSGRR